MNSVRTVGYGGVARYQTYVFATDMKIAGDAGSQRGIVRFNLSTGAIARYATGADYIDVTVGKDGLLYALQSANGKVDVFNPATMSSVRSVNLPTSPGGQSATYPGVTANSAGLLFAVSWEGKALKFSPTGTFQSSVSVTGGGAVNPIDIDLAGDGRVVVGTASGHVVQLTESLTNVTTFYVGGTTAYVAFAEVDYNTPPQISDFPPRIGVAVNGTSMTLPFQVTDDQSPPSALTVTATSNNPTLLKDSGITLGVSGPDRTIFVTPEPNQTGSATVTVTVTDPQGASTSKSFVVDVSNAPTISDVHDVTIPENGTTGAITFTVGDLETSAGQLSVGAGWSGGTLFPSGSVVLGGSGANRTVTITPAPGQIGSTTFTLSVYDQANVFASDSFTVTVANTPPTISDVADRIIHVGGSTGAIAFTIGDFETAADNLSVTWSSSNGVMFPPGGIVLGGSGADRTITATPYPNYFGWTTITLTVTDGQGLTATDSFEVRVNTPVITIADVTHVEGNSGTTAYVFTLSMSPVSEIPVTVNYATANGTATAGSDYTAASGTLTFAVGESSKTVTVLVTGDRNEEPNETFVVNLSNPAGVVILDGQGVGTIRTDDGRQEFWAGAWGQYVEYFNSSPTVQNGGTYIDTFSATEPGVLAGGPAPREARGLLEFNVGSVAAADVGAAVLEFSETYFYELSNPVQVYGYAGDGAISLADGTTPGVLLGSFDPRTETGRRWVSLDAQALAGLIAAGPNIGLRLVTTPDSQARIATGGSGQSPPKLVLLPAPFVVPQVSVSDTQTTEGDLVFGQPQNGSGLFFTISLSEPTSIPVTVYYTLTAGTAQAGSDFDATPWQVTLYPGWTSTTIYVPVTFDNVLENTETMSLQLHNPMYGTIADGNATGTILDNDAAPVANAGPDVAITTGTWVHFSGLNSVYNPYGNINVTWNYGDGTTGQGIIPPDHQYMWAGTYTVTLTIADADRGTSTDTLVVSVTGTQMGLQFGGAAAAVAGQERSYTFTVYGLNGQPYGGTYSLQINWGDAIETWSNNTLNRPTLTATHIYSYFSNFTMSVQVSASGQAGSGSRQVPVTPTLVEGGTLYVGGDNANEDITLASAGSSGGVTVTRYSVNLGTFFPADRIVVFGGAGIDIIRVNSTTVNGQTYAITKPLVIFGGFQDDTINASGAGGPVAMVGGGGRDNMTGSAFNDILIGGNEADQLFGGEGSDILIGSMSTFEMNPDALVAIMAEWSRTDLSLQARYDHISWQSGGLNTGYYLWSSTVVNDNYVDNLWGQGGTDWFMSHLGGAGVDLRKDYVAGELYTNL